MEENSNQQIEIDLPQDMAYGVYSNLAIISHSPTEFVSDFIQLTPNTPKAFVRSRVIMAPENAKRFMKAMQDNIRKYEDMFGRIKDTDTPPVYPNTFQGGGPPTAV
ncbi:MAG: DUF3467 domain-containing protein [Chitinophagales bacterium]